jgi:hypothetical protein
MSDELNVIALLREAAGSASMRGLARIKLAELITEGDLLGHQTRKPEIRPSDFGSCRLALWATINGRDDIERDPIDDTLARLDFGSLVGAWEACLLWSRAEADPTLPWDFELEYVPEGGGHIDVLARHRATGEHVPIEFKSTYSTPTAPIKPPEKENKAHMLQLGDYANRVEPRASRMILVYIKPPASAGERMKQFERDAEPWAPLVANERDRLADALGVDPPVADPQTRWACFTCRYGFCAKNKNKAAKSVEALLG